MEHPSVEIQFPFDGEDHYLGVPSNTTHFYWGAIGIGTLHEPISLLLNREVISQSALLQTVQDRVSCSLTLDGNAEPLLQEIRRSGKRCQHAFWKAVDLASLPITATVTLTTAGEAPSIDGEPAELWTHNDEVISWNETVQTKLRIVPIEDIPEMKTDGLWGRNDVYVPNYCYDM